MNILIITAVFPPEPVVSAKLSYDIVKALSEDNKLTVISPRPSRPYKHNFSDYKPDTAIKHIYADSYTCPQMSMLGRFRESYSFGKHCSGYIRKNHKEINIIYANTWPLFAQLFVIRAAKKYHIPVVIHIQDVYPESLTKKIPLLGKLIKSILLPFDRHILRHATKIIAISEKMKDYLSATRNIPADKISVIHNWQDEKMFVDHSLNRNDNLSGSRPFTFMYLGNIGPVAGVDLLIEAFADTNLVNAKLVIAGSGSMKEKLEKKTSELKLPAIEFVSVPDGKVPEVQAQADILLLPMKKGTAASSVPSKLSAYMISSKPVIGCVDENSDTAEVIRRSGCGWIVRPEDPKLLAKLMKKVVSLPVSNLQKIGANGYNYAIEHFSKKNNLVHLTKIIKETSPGNN